MPVEDERRARPLIPIPEDLNNSVWSQSEGTFAMEGLDQRWKSDSERNLFSPVPPLY